MGSTVALDVESSGATARLGTRRDRWRVDPLTVVAVLAALAFALVGIGTPLVRLRFRSPDHHLGWGLTLISLFIFAVVIVYPRLARATPRRRRG